MPVTSRNRLFSRLALPGLALAVAVTACGTEGDAAPPAFDTVHDEFIANLGVHCGEAFAGRVVSAPEGDPNFAGDPELILHFRTCTDNRVTVPVFLGDDASRTWIFWRTGDGVDLRHDHRHADGRSEPMTYYGSFVADIPIAEESPSANRHEFKRVQNEVRTGWVVEIIPGERYTYGTQRDGEWRHRFDFDLSTPVAVPPDPWGHPPVGGSATLAGPQATFIESLAAHCGQAYEGAIIQRPEGDQLFQGDEVLTADFRECTDQEVKIAFHVADNRSRTWVLTPTTAGIDLRHDHRHEDGSPEPNTWYGAHTQALGTAVRQEFLREPRPGAEDAPVSGWAIEIVPNERYTYGTIRDGEWSYRLDFDLTTPVANPPAPWGN